MRFVNDLAPSTSKPMLHLALSIGFSVFLGICFKLWPRYQVRVLPGILHNYIACVAVAGWMTGQWPIDGKTFLEPWFFLACGLSLLFIAGFYLYAVSIHVWGMATMSAVQKMSLLISALFAIVVYHETLSFPKAGGIALGMASIPLLLYRTSANPANALAGQPPMNWRAYILVISTFLIAGAIEIGLFVAESGLVQVTADPRFIAVIFSGAFLAGWGFCMLSIKERKGFFSIRHMVAGWVLGVPNFFSIYFLMRAIGGELDASIVFPVNNTATILLSTLLGVFLFREAFVWRNGLGILFALLALLLLTNTA